MGKLLYVGNLSAETTEHDLEELFSRAGTVESATVMRHTNTGDSKGFGFVQMSNDQEAASAIAQFNGKELNRRKIQVNESRNQHG